MLRNLSLTTLVAAMVLVSSGSAKGPAGNDREKKSLSQAMREYEDAFNRADAKRLAAYWTEAGQYLTASGKRIEGRDAIREAYKTLFAEGKGLRLEAMTSSLQLIASNVAIEEGVARLTCASEPPARARYEAIHVKEDGQWRLSRVREAALHDLPSHHEQLKDLDWMIGQWSSRDQDETVHNKCEWTKSKTYITRSFSVTVEDRVAVEGTQFIGWDASTQQIRSWSFDNEGGFEHGVWRRVDDRWIVDATVVLPDGRQGSAERILTPIDDDKFTWRSVHRQVDGQLLPSLDAVTIVRTGATAG